MCGINGIFDIRGRRDISETLLSAMTASQEHRGPDDAGTHREPGLGLGHRRLSIIGVSTGHQPLFNEDGSVAVVFNGEIYNFMELRAELESAGHQFRTRCDTEVIVHGWEEWGEQCVHRFRGMFAFAIWDRNRRMLFMARDRLGIKPLYYTLTNDGYLIFSSELKALLVHPECPREIDPYASEDYFAFGYVPDPRTIFRNVYKLPPAHRLTVPSGGGMASPVEYWDVSFDPLMNINETEAMEGLLERLEESVRLRMVSEVPLGAFLSGGVDSSAVVAIMAALSENPVNTCSISFNEKGYDEQEYANSVAESFRTAHYVEKVESDDFDLIDRLSGIYDEPFADSSAIPTYRVCQMARRRVTVALSGDGGDENLAGYRRYRWHVQEERMRAMLPLGARKLLFGTLARLYPKANWAPRMLRAKATFQSLAKESLEGYFDSVAVVKDRLRSNIYSTEFRKELAGYTADQVLRSHAENAPDRSPLSTIQYLDLKTYLPGDILTKVDRASMAHGLEVRVPLLDHELVEWIARIPDSLKMHRGEGKYIFKKAMRKHLPHDVLYRRKMGFAVPLARWFRGPLRERVSDALLGSTLRDTGMFDSRHLKNILNQHQSGEYDNSAAIWSLLMYESFLRRTVSSA